MGTAVGERARFLLRGNRVAVPAHFDAEVFSALGRLQRAGEVEAGRVEWMLQRLARAPFDRHSIAPLLSAGWSLRHNFSLRDTLYVVLARTLEAELLTADRRLAKAPLDDVTVTVVKPKSS